MEIIKDGRIVDDHWRHLRDDDDLVAGPITVSFARWQSEREELVARPDPFGVRLRGGDALPLIAADAMRFAVIVLEFDNMADGRHFSHARLLRERYGYTGEIRARGAFIRDQVFFLSRVGVNAFEMEDSNRLEGALSALADFSVRYQAAADERKPLYRRRFNATPGTEQAG